MLTRFCSGADTHPCPPFDPPTTLLRPLSATTSLTRVFLPSTRPSQSRRSRMLPPAAPLPALAAWVPPFPGRSTEAARRTFSRCRSHPPTTAATIPQQLRMPPATINSGPSWPTPGGRPALRAAPTPIRSPGCSHLLNHRLSCPPCLARGTALRATLSSVVASFSSPYRMPNSRRFHAPNPPTAPLSLLPYQKVHPGAPPHSPSQKTTFTPSECIQSSESVMPPRTIQKA
jgi:hypothetical protein